MKLVCNIITQIVSITLYQLDMSTTEREAAARAVAALHMDYDTSKQLAPPAVLERASSSSRIQSVDDIKTLREQAE